MEGQSPQEANIEKQNLPKQKRSFFLLFQSIFEFFLVKNSKEKSLKSLNKLVSRCADRCFISYEEQRMINNIVSIDDIKVSDVMIPRTYIVAMPKDSSLKQIKDMIIKKEHTRMPIYGENLDEIIGFIHSKDLVKFLSKEEINFDINTLIRKIIYVPHSMKIVDLLRKMRSSRVHIAIVLDEYGGTDGLITIEDIMEEIVGEIEDEHDIPENNIYNKIQKVNSNTFHIGGRVEIEEVEKLFSRSITNDYKSADFETIGGLILLKVKKIPQIGEVIKFDNLSIKVLDADLRSIKLLEISYIE